MATIKKVRRRKFNFNSIILLVFILSLMSFFYTSIFTRSNNVNLNIEIQNLNKQIAQTKIVNESLALEIQQLASYDSVQEIAREAGLTNKQNNIVMIREMP